MEKPCRLGRVRLAGALDRAAWRSWDGGGWSGDVSRAVAVFDGNDIMAVARGSAARVFLAIYSRPMGARTTMRAAPAPQGPWSRAVKRFDGEDPEGGG